MKSRLWYYKYRGDFYALGPLRFDEPKSEREVRAHLREMNGVSRLPIGMEIWATSERELHQLIEMSKEYYAKMRR